MYLGNGYIVGILLDEPYDNSNGWTTVRKIAKSQVRIINLIYN